MAADLLLVTSIRLAFSDLLELKKKNLLEKNHHISCWLMQ